MGFVTYGQSGYVGSSMSVRAMEAYNAGEMPVYKWTKQAIIDAVKEYCYQFDLKMPDDLVGMRKRDLVDTFLEYKSWHHTGAGLRETEFYGLNEEAVCAMCPEMSREEIAARDGRIAAERQARDAREAYRRERLGEFKERFGCDPSSLMAYEAIHPDRCERFTSRKGTPCIAYRLPPEAVAQGMVESQTTPVEYSAGRRVAGFNAFRTWEGKSFVWHDVDMDEVQKMFDERDGKYGGAQSESLDEMMSAKENEAELEQEDQPSGVKEINER